MARNVKFQKLLEPGYIGAVRTKNRMVRMGALPGYFTYEDGYFQQYYFDFYVALAKGGAGLVTITCLPVDAPSKSRRIYLFDDDKYIPRMQEFTGAMHEYGTPVFMQMMGCGPWLPPPRTVAASSISEDEMPIMLMNFPNARELTADDIKDIVQKFGNVAERAQKAGFDGIEINAGSTHLLSTFLSRAWNRRQDEYGCGTIENRARIVAEIIQEIKRRNGKDFAIDVVFNAAEPGLENGNTLEESTELAKSFEAAGADAIQARAEFFITRKATHKNDCTHFPDVALYPEAPLYAAPSGMDISHHGAGGWVPLAAAIKKAVKIPVIAVGRIDPEMGEKLIKRGLADFVNLNRRLIADHELPNKVIEGRLKDIAPCTACMTCFNVMKQGQPLICRINAAMGKETEYEIKPATKKKKVAVIGSGPAGMEAARVAALRGHQVILFEKEPMLGGGLNLAAIVKGTEREDLLGIIEYLKAQINKAGVDVRLGKEANKPIIEELKPDAVIVAIGGSHNIPDIPGIDKRNVLTSQALHNQLKNYLKMTGAKLMTKLVNKYVPVGKSVVIMGGDIQGCETAEFLVKRSRKVTIVESGPEIGNGLLPDLIGPQLLDWLDKKGVTMITGAKYEEITDKGLIITNKDGKKQTIEADTILTTLPLQPNNGLFNSLKDIAPEVYEIGDGKQPRLIVDAIAEGARIARIV